MACSPMTATTPGTPTSAPHALETRLQHAGSAPFHPETGTAPVTIPAVRTSTVRFRSLDVLDAAQAARARGERVPTYGRVGLDAHAALEDVFCELEGAGHAVLASSGMAAITLALLALTQSGDHVLVSDSVYGPVRQLDAAVLRRYGVSATYCPGTVAAMAAARRPETRVLYVESPGSLLFEMLDLPALAAFAREHGLVLVVDNTWGSGLIYRPLALGAHISVMAGTKYVGGHSDLLLGAAVTSDAALHERLRQTHYALGYAVGADDAWLALRGVRTMPLRMAHCAASALAVCRFLAGRPEVARVFHPAWQDDPRHAIWQRDALGSNGMLSVALTLDAAASRRVVDALTLFGIGYSWGGFESLVQWIDPATLADHAYWQAYGQPDWPVLRLQIGLESPDDLIADLARALDLASRA